MKEKATEPSIMALVEHRYENLYLRTYGGKCAMGDLLCFLAVCAGFMRCS